MAMETAREFDDFIALGITSGETDGGHGGFGATVTHAYFFDRWDHLDDQFGHLDFIRIGCPKAGAFLKCLADRCTYVWIVVPMDRRAPGADKVDQVFAIGRMQVCAFSAFGKERCAAN